MNAGENPVTWSYEIRDSKNVIVATEKGFDTEKAAMAAGRKKARLQGFRFAAGGRNWDSESRTRVRSATFPVSNPA
jgi:hypothetical protein